MYLYVFLYQMVQKFLLGQFVLGSVTPQPDYYSCLTEFTKRTSRHTATTATTTTTRTGDSVGQHCNATKGRWRNCIRRPSQSWL